MLTRLAVKLAAPLAPIESFQRYMFIGPHPDDIEIGAGATAAKLAAQGKSVCFLICLDGRYGDGNVAKGTTTEELIALRKAEAICSAEHLGVHDVRFLGLSDGGFYNPEELTAGIARAVGDFKPDIIFAPDPDVASECHADHLNVGKSAKTVAEFAPYPGIMKQYGAESAPVEAIALYMTARPNSFVKTQGYFRKQLESVFSCHLSQFPEGSSEGKSIALYLKLRSAEFGLRNFCLHAEGFRMLNKTGMHCLPEAGL